MQIAHAPIFVGKLKQKSTALLAGVIHIR